MLVVGTLTPLTPAPSVSCCLLGAAWQPAPLSFAPSPSLGLSLLSDPTRSCKAPFSARVLLPRVLHVTFQEVWEL